MSSAAYLFGALGVKVKKTPPNQETGSFRNVGLLPCKGGWLVNWGLMAL